MSDVDFSQTGTEVQNQARAARKPQINPAIGTDRYTPFRTIETAPEPDDTKSQGEAAEAEPAPINVAELTQRAVSVMQHIETLEKEKQRLAHDLAEANATIARLQEHLAITRSDLKTAEIKAESEHTNRIRLQTMIGAIRRAMDETIDIERQT